MGKLTMGNRCACGTITGTRCEARWLPASAPVVVEWMPDYLRASHTAARNAGGWPQNGAERLTLHPDCAALAVDAEPEWCTVIGPTAGEARIAARVAALMASGMNAGAALDAVCGPGTFQALASDLYDTLRARATDGSRYHTDTLIGDTLRARATDGGAA